jgi:hypothetical protein
MRKIWLYILSVVLICLPVSVQADFFVSPSQGIDSNPGTLAQPFQTIDRARVAVQGINATMQNDLRVYLRGGFYPLATTLTFGAADSGVNGYTIIYQAFGNELPVISGDASITGWVLQGGGIWRAPVSGGLRFRQLYINGVRGIRARQPNAGAAYNHLTQWNGAVYAGLSTWDPNTHSIDIPTTDITGGPWTNLGKIEMVVSMQWQQLRARILSFTTSGATTHVEFVDPDARKAFMWDLGLYNPGQAYFFENAREFIDQPGEWYNDEAAGFVYYLPRAGEIMGSATVMAPALDGLVKFVNTSNVRLQGLTLEGSTWLLPSNEGFINAQGDYFRVPDDSTRYSPSGLIHAEYSSNLTFERNILRHVGGTAVTLWNGSRSILIEGNILTDIAAGGIDSAIGINLAAPSDQLQNITIANNYINGYGKDYYGAQGTQSHFVDTFIATHNEVTDGGYTGIGFDWRSDDGSTTANVQVTYNVMNKMAVGGGIYSFHVTRPSTNIYDNYVNSLTRSSYAGTYPVAAVYLDESTDWTTVVNNVLVNVDTVFNINTTAVNNSISGYNPTADAAIQANAGLQAAFQDIKTGPTSLKAVMSWGASVDEVGGSGLAGYILKRGSGSPCTPTTYQTLGISALGYTDLSILPNVMYCYSIASFDVAGNPSTDTAIVAFMAIDVTPPTQVVGVTVTPGTAQMTVAWPASTDTGSGIAGYHVLRCTNPGCTNPTPLTDVGPTILTLLDAPLAASMTFGYAVVAFDFSGNPALASAIAYGTTPPPVPSAPSVPSAGLPATYTWIAVINPGDLAGYNVYRKLEACAGPTATTLIAALGNVLTYQDVTIPNGTTAICVQLSSRDTTGNVSAKSIGTDKSLPASSGLAHILTIQTDKNGATLGFVGLAYAVRYWTDSIAKASAIVVSGLGGVTTYRHNIAWPITPLLTMFTCYAAQDVNGIWENDLTPSSYHCVPVDLVKPPPLTNISISRLLQ